MKERFETAPAWLGDGQVATLLLLLAVAATFLPSLSLGILNSWDDDVFITNELARLQPTLPNLWWWLTHHVVDNYMPLTMYTYMLDGVLWHFAPWGMHLQNVCWHGVAVLGFYWCLRRLGCGGTGALLGALFWAVHPQRAESVAWLAERKDVVCAAFFFWSAWAYFRGDGKRTAWLSAVLFLAAMAAKPMAVSLPAVLLAWEFYRRRDWHPLPWLRRLWAHLLIVALFIPVTLAVSRYSGVVLPWSRRLAAMLHNLVFYAVKTAAPVDLNPFYGYLLWTPEQIATTAVGLGLTAAGAILLWRRERTRCLYGLLPLLAAYAAVLLPVSGLVQLGGIDRADRYSYLPSAVLILAAVRWLEALYRDGDAFRGPAERLLGDYLRRRTVYLSVMMAVVIGLYGYETFGYQRTWESVYRICRVSSQAAHPNAIALATLGHFELGRGNLNAAFTIARRLYASPYRNPGPDDMCGHFADYIQGTALYRSGRREKARERLEAVRAFVRDYYRETPEKYRILLANLADCYFSRGDATRAAAAYDELIALSRPGSFDDHYFRGLRSFCGGDIPAAATSMRAALSLEPHNENALRALRAFEAMLKSRPASPRP